MLNQEEQEVHSEATINSIPRSPLGTPEIQTNTPSKINFAGQELQQLANLDRICVIQSIELGELFGWEGNNKYEVINTNGQRLFLAVEKSGCCVRMLMRNSRPFEVTVMDQTGKPIFMAKRPCTCALYCFGGTIYGSNLIVETTQGEPLGWGVQDINCCVPTYDVNDASGRTVLKIRGRCCACQCCVIIFQVFRVGDMVNPIGKITKEWAGFMREAFTNANKFSIEFEPSLPVNLKATLIGMMFLIDFQYFEKNSGACTVM